MDPREDIALALDPPEMRRTSVAPPPLRHLAKVPPAPTETAPTSEEPSGPDDDQTGLEELPGRRRSRLQYLELYVTGRAYDLLTAQRPAGSTMGQAVMEALRHTRPWLVETYSPPPADDDFFPAPRRSRRRFHVEGGRHVSAGVTPQEAAAISRLAADVDLTLSELISLAVEHHFAEGRP